MVFPRRLPGVTGLTPVQVQQQLELLRLSPSASVDLTPLESSVAAVEATVASQGSDLDVIEASVADLEAAVAALGPGSVGSSFGIEGGNASSVYGGTAPLDAGGS